MSDTNADSNAPADVPMPQSFPPALRAHMRNILSQIYSARGDWRSRQTHDSSANEELTSSHDTDSEEQASSPSEEAMTFAGTMSDEPDSESSQSFDVALPATHSYLGDTVDLERGSCILDDEHRCSLPLILLEDVVLMPGMSVPLRLNVPAEIAWMNAIVQAPQPYTRLLTVVGCKRSAWGWSEWDTAQQSESPVARMGCTAEVRQMRREDCGTITCVAIGQQRAELQSQNGQALPTSPESCQAVRQQWPVRIHGEDMSGRLQAEAGSNSHHWPAWVHRNFAAGALADAAVQLYSDVLPKGRAFQGSAEELSWWLAANLPLQHTARQELLEAPCAASRLRSEIALMRRQRCLHCSSCRMQVASVASVIAMSESGAAGVFLNQHGYVHDMVTLSKTVNVIPHGMPETVNSWFPGYAWTLAYCRSCNLHLGWKFTAVCPNKTHPGSFWGLRRTALSEGPRPDETRSRRAAFWQAAS